MWRAGFETEPPVAARDRRLFACATAEKGRARGGVLSPVLRFLCLIERGGSWGGSSSAFDSSLLHSRNRVQWVWEPLAPLSARPRPPVALALAPAMKRIFSCSSSQVAVGTKMSGEMGMGLGSKPCGGRSQESHLYVPLPFLFSGFPALPLPQCSSPVLPSSRLTSDFSEVLSVGLFLFPMSDVSSRPCPLLKAPSSTFALHPSTDHPQASALSPVPAQPQIPFCLMVPFSSPALS